MADAVSVLKALWPSKQPHEMAQLAAGLQAVAGSASPQEDAAVGADRASLPLKTLVDVLRDGRPEGPQGAEESAVAAAVAFGSLLAQQQLCDAEVRGDAALHRARQLLQRTAGRAVGPDDPCDSDRIRCEAEAGVGVLSLDPDVVPWGELAAVLAGAGAAGLPGAEEPRLAAGDQSLLASAAMRRASSAWDGQQAADAGLQRVTSVLDGLRKAGTQWSVESLLSAVQRTCLLGAAPSSGDVAGAVQVATRLRRP